ncbi:hypothetical protein M2459_000703 [Parabacteroides sp. PF5-5]|nr:hypothetical protein [Parabacteroides sp. PH5-39]MDH6314686.1 hypothetical protein [Parabacteroides sp. PF5-13]MDH6318023.1 hypothetical protein [Parabacteroides sp. PH5-13]MDH6322046.1 hypothetical protein [Parabacteroides sp. PH5-8]MDH6326169.1 hypothetical protein [Parabacteroides sp. PH5-41]MDH6333969.1 hypothetical protein [Parabacteroides sp. PF5-5]MDH6345034.1 hypothetical protein [Parabacteroides sp. PH5-46]MDH6359696.1 hypothetical protein [Parabacteroides sp. PH5-16]MDH6375363.
MQEEGFDYLCSRRISKHNEYEESQYHEYCIVGLFGSDGSDRMARQEGRSELYGVFPDHRAFGWRNPVAQIRTKQTGEVAREMEKQRMNETK